jgi:hypothetical protein
MKCVALGLQMHSGWGVLVNTSREHKPSKSWSVRAS